MKLATISRYESASRPWLRLLEIAGDHFPDALADLTFLRRCNARLELHVDDARLTYVAQLVGQEVATVEARRQDQGRISLTGPLAAVAEDIREYEVAAAQRLAREVAKGALTPKSARSLCDGLGYEAFDVELSRYRAELARYRAANPKGAKWWSFLSKMR
jgi:hypothetical protein